MLACLPLPTGNMKVITVPLFEDNYSYLIVDEASNEALVVDPAVPKTYVSDHIYASHWQIEPMREA